MKRFLAWLLCLAIIAPTWAQQVDVVQPPTLYPTVTFANLPTASANTGRIYNAGDVGINGCPWRSNGVKWGIFGGSCVLVQNAMPWIALSSGSTSAGGAITGITALPIVYAKAWVYLPANNVATVATAGWRYATCSTTTACTVFLDQPSATFPVVWPTSPTAVTDGKGSFTGVTGEVDLPSITVVANSMGINGRLQTDMSMATTSSANYKYFGMKFPTLDNRITQAAATTGLNLKIITQNTGGAAVQSVTAFSNGATGSNYANNGPGGTNTAIDNVLLWSINRQTATDNAIVENFTTTLYNDGQ